MSKKTTNDTQDYSKLPSSVLHEVFLTVEDIQHYLLRQIKILSITEIVLIVLVVACIILNITTNWEWCRILSDICATILFAYSFYLFGLLNSSAYTMGKEEEIIRVIKDRILKEKK